MFRLVVKGVAISCLLLAAFLPAAQGQEGRPDEITVGIFTYLSGPPGVYGVPGRDAAEVMIEDINSKGGIAGVPLRAVYVDEGPGLEHVVSEYRRLSGEVDAMIAALSSSHCLALAPVAEELRVLNLMWNCDAHTVFEGKQYRYVFRPNTNTVSEFVAAALYTAKRFPGVRRVAIINPDYAFGHDARDIYLAALRRFIPDIQVVAELFPRLGAPDFSTEISRLAALRPDLVFSNLWGGDVATFVRQAAARGLLDQSTFVFALAEAELEVLGHTMPEGHVLGLISDNYWMSPRAQANPENTRFVNAYRERTGLYPVQQAYKMAHTILFLKAAYEEALARNPDRWPATEDLVDALYMMELETFTGKLALREDNDGLMDQLLGMSKHVPEFPFAVLDEMIYFPAELVTPPVGMYMDWVETLDPDMLDRLPDPIPWTAPSM